MTDTPPSNGPPWAQVLTKQDVQELGLQMQGRMSQMGSRLIRWMVSLASAAALLTVGSVWLVLWRLGGF